MSTRSHPTRRAFLAQHARNLAVITMAPAALSACQSPNTMRSLSLTTLSQAQHELDRLSKLSTLHSVAQWSWAATLQHAAQSIEFAMTGFPQAKPAWFQHTVGATAFKVFSWRERMSHSLIEPIPGAAPLQQDADPHMALAHLHATIDAFHRHQGPLHPHFAYGALSKSEYELANAMHVANHLSEFDVKA